MSTLPYIAPQPLSDSGAVQSGAKLYFYTTGASTTPKDTYSDKALTSANANPVVADASGRFGPIFLKKDGGYRAVLKTSADVTIWTKDEVFAPALAVDSDTRRQNIARSPMDHGATGDGVANDATALAAALAQISSDGGGTLDLEGKTYRCDSTLTLFSNLTIQNGTLNFASHAGTVYLQAHGSVGAYTNLTANATFQTRTLSCTSVSGFAAGDLLNVIASDDYTNIDERGEIVEIDSISSLNVTTAAPILDAYTTANTARAAKITPIRDLILDNVRIVCSTSASGSQPVVVSLRSCHRVTLRRVRIASYKSIGVHVLGSVDVLFDSCTWDESATGAETNGIYLRGACQDITVRRCIFTRLRGGVISHGSSSPLATVEGYASHALGVRRRVWVDDCVFEGMGNVSVLFGEDSQYVAARRNFFNLVSGGAQGIVVSCVDYELANNIFCGTDANDYVIGEIAPATVRNHFSRVDQQLVEDSGTSASGTRVPGGDVLRTTVSITNTEIVGNAAGDLGHASGVTLVAAQSGYIIEVLCVRIAFTYATAAYTGGGNVSCKYDGGEDITGVTTAGESFGAGASNIQVLRPLSGAALNNTKVVLVAASAFTDPGTAAGTAKIITDYRLIPAG